jgi:hypothetical protein
MLQAAQHVETRLEENGENHTGVPLISIAKYTVLPSKLSGDL